MALTGLLFGAVVVMWGVFLVPWALRRYDEATSVRSIETFSDAMRVLGRFTEQPAPRSARAPSGASVRLPSRAAARAAAARRRRVLLTLLGVLLVVATLVAVGVVPLWVLAVPAALVVGWLVLCRVQVRSEDAAAWARRRGTGDPVDDEETARISIRGIAAPATRSHDHEDAAAGIPEQDLVEATSVAVPVTTADGASLWDPLPVTLPTYVSKPRATRSIRTIDLGTPGAWTSGHVDGEQTEMPAGASTAEHRRAVGD